MSKGSNSVTCVAQRIREFDLIPRIYYVGRFSATLVGLHPSNRSVVIESDLASSSYVERIFHSL